jgi:hypothetical protein
MATRNFNNTTVAGTLSAPAAPADVSMSTTGFTGQPTVPFTATINRGTPTEEVVLVTAVNSGILTVTRGYNGTAATTHLAGSTVEHTAVALDFSEANAHVNGTSNVHGITGPLVGTEAAQTLLDKTLISAVHEADVTAGDAIVAYVPVGAEARSLFRGMDPGGDDVVVITSAGFAYLSGVHSLANLEVDGNTQLDGTLAVTGTTTLTGAVTIPVQSAASSPARKEYVDAIGTASNTGNTVVRRNSDGDFETRTISLWNPPTAAAHVTRKDYVDAADAALDTRVDALEATTAATEVTYGSGWVGYVDASIPWAGVKYWKKGNVVTLSGAMTASGAKAAGNIAFTLPAGFRPPYTVNVTPDLSSPTSFVLRATGEFRLAAAVSSGAAFGFAVTYLV